MPNVLEIPAELHPTILAMGDDILKQSKALLEENGIDPGHISLELTVSFILSTEDDEEHETQAAELDEPSLDLPESVADALSDIMDEESSFFSNVAAPFYPTATPILVRCLLYIGADPLPYFYFYEGLITEFKDSEEETLS